ncbi:MAG: glycosyltransferase family 39 protein [Elusimicrobia bacterium]|nr:glycosyltransferase family 39 protein [Elusimicrobiota bacterium]
MTVSSTSSDRKPAALLTFRGNRALLGIFFAVLAVRVIVAALMWPAADEAYYYVYTLFPSLSYFDHPPLSSFVGSLIPSVAGWVTPLGIRLVPIIFFSASIFIFFLLASEFMTDKEAALSTAVFMCTPMFMFAGTFFLPDYALVLFWLAGLLSFRKTLENPSAGNWIFLGILAGLGMLSKYTAGFIYSGVLLFLLLDGRRRKLLLTPGPYLFILAGIAVFLPVIIWNSNNGFVSFAFQGGRVGAGSIKMRYFYQSFFGQMAYLLPFFFFPAVYYAFRYSVKPAGKDRMGLFVFCFGSVPVLLFLAVSLFKRVLPHWPITGYIVLALPVGRYYYGMMSNRKNFFVFYSVMHTGMLAAAVLLTLLQMHFGMIMNREVTPAGISGKREPVRDITIDIIGWRELDKYLEGADFKDVFLFTHKWYLGGQIAFATGGRYPVLCLGSSRDARGFRFWQDSGDYIGKDGIFVCTSKFFKDPMEKYSGYFDDIRLMEMLPVRRRGKTVKIIYLYKCSVLKRKYY